jgi:hypothetical protein
MLWIRIMLTHDGNCVETGDVGHDVELIWFGASSKDLRR